MEALYQDSDNVTPVVFVLSQGADPTNQLLKFGEEREFSDRIVVTALGQG